MTIAAYQPDGHYQNYLVNQVLSATFVGPWIRMPAGHKNVLFENSWVATGAPVGTITVEATNKPNPGDADGVAISATVGASPNNDTNASSPTTAAVIYTFVRQKYTRSGGGSAASLMQSHARTCP